jgi:hypothetical protein
MLEVSILSLFLRFSIVSLTFSDSTVVLLYLTTIRPGVKVHSKFKAMAYIRVYINTYFRK